MGRAKKEEMQGGTLDKPTKVSPGGTRDKNIMEERPKHRFTKESSIIQKLKEAVTPNSVIREKALANQSLQKSIEI